jgi:hypothetical protein
MSTRKRSIKAQKHNVFLPLIDSKDYSKQHRPERLSDNSDKLT